MNLWCHALTTNRKLRLSVYSGLVLLCVVILTALFFTQPSSALEQTISFQGRLSNKNGTPVKSGYYNVQFSLYQGGDGQSVANDKSQLVWRESYLNSGQLRGIKVKDGRFSVQLGSQTAFSSKVNWQSNQLWLAMNIAGDGTCQKFGDDCSADGELLPMTKVSASAYAMSAGSLNGKTADDFAQIGGGKQTDSGDKDSIFINKTGQGDLIRLQNNGDDTYRVTRSGDIVFGAGRKKTISIEKSTDDSRQGQDLAIKAGSASDKSQQAGGDLILEGGDSQSGNGGDLVLKGGGGKNDVDGLVIIGTPTFSTTTADPNCYPNGQLAKADCQIAAKSVNTSAAIIAGFDKEGLTATLPEPELKTAGRVVYVIGASDSAAFKLDIGTTNELTVLPDSAASLIWSGSNWAAVGAPASPTLPPDKPPTPDSAPVETPTDQGLAQPDSDATPPDDDGKDIIGSMFYDDALGKIQCFQADGWGDCDAAPDIFMTISPEYANAVMNGSDIGVITSDLCSGVLGVNDGSDEQPNICEAKETYNFYSWTSDKEADQTRSIYINYKLPANFKKFVANSASLDARVDSDQAKVQYRLYRDSQSDGLRSCGSEIPLSGDANKWHRVVAGGASDPADCQFTAGDSLLIRIDMTAKNDSTAFISNINFIISTK